MSSMIFGLGGTGIKSLVHIKKMLQDSNERGEVPNNVRLFGIDTRSTPEQVKVIGAWTSVASRRLGVDPNASQLDPYAEYYWIGGDSEREVCGDGRTNPGWPPDHYSTNWFDLRYFRNHPAHAKLLTIIDGAGMYPQIGRLGLFSHLKTGITSPLYQQIFRAMQGLQTQVIEIVLIGSLAGGTGTSLFIDMAHLCRVIADNAHKSVQITTILVLPRAFQWNPPVAVDNAMEERAMLGLRSLLRFSTIHNSNLGFYFRYTEDQDNAINRRTRGALFDMIYLMEERALGHGQQQIDNPLNMPIHEGMAPTIAAWISALCDGSIATEANAWIANMRAIEAGVSFQGLVPGFCCSFGTYSIVLPLSVIVENWTASLGWEVLEHLVPQKGDGTIDSAKYGGELSLSGSDQARRDWDKCIVRIARDAGRIGASWSKQTETALQTGYQTRIVQDWLQIFIDQFTSQEDIEKFDQMREKNAYYYNDQAGFRVDPFKGAMARPIPKRSMGGSAAAAANALHERCKVAYDEKAAVWVTALNNATDRQIFDYRVALNDFVRTSLNGDSLDSALKARSGKPGWLFDYIGQQRKDLANALKVLQLAMNSVKADLNDIEAEWLAGGRGQAGLFQQMQQDDSKQKDYLRKRQEWLKNKRWLLFADAYTNVLTATFSYTKAMESELKSYIDALIKIKVSLKTFQTDTDYIRESAHPEYASVREMIRDQDWENDQYKLFHNQPNQEPSDEAALRNIDWGVKEVTRDKTIVPTVSLHIHGFQPIPNSALESNEITVDSSVDEELQIKVNQTRLMELCRKDFLSAWEKLSVVDYLTYLYNGKNKTAAELAIHLHKKGNALLTAGNGNCVQPSWSVNLLAPQSGVDSQLLQHVSRQLQIMTGAQQQFAKVLPHDDPTMLTYITIVMGVEIKKLDAYRNPQLYYLSLPVDSIGTEVSRKLNAIFPAERNVAQFDRILTNGAASLVSPRPTMVMEDEERLMNWIDALALGIITPIPRTLANNQVGDLFQLCLIETINLRGEQIQQERVYWLNDPQDYIDGFADYIVAAETYCLRDYEYSHQRLPMEPAYPLVNKAIDEKMKAKLAEFMPIWENNGGTSTAIAVYKMPPGNLRDTLLLQETRKELYRRLSPQIVSRLTDLQATPPRNASATTLKTLEDEIEFLSIIERRIQEITSQTPRLRQN